jgi:hypothetical protein
MSFQNFKFPTSTNPNAPKKFKIIKEYKEQLSPIVSKTFFIGEILGGKRLNKDKQPIKVTKASIACFAPPCPEMWNEEDTAFLEITSDKSVINIPIEYLQEVVEPKPLTKREAELELANLQIEIAKLPTGAAERDKLIAKQNALQAELNPAAKSKLPIYIGLVVGALVISYFAYKKLKK